MKKWQPEAKEIGEANRNISIPAWMKLQNLEKGVTPDQVRAIHTYFVIFAKRGQLAVFHQATGLELSHLRVIFSRVQGLDTTLLETYIAVSHGMADEPLSATQKFSQREMNALSAELGIIRLFDALTTSAACIEDVRKRKVLPNNLIDRLRNLLIRRGIRHGALFGTPCDFGGRQTVLGAEENQASEREKERKQQRMNETLEIMRQTNRAMEQRAMREAEREKIKKDLERFSYEFIDQLVSNFRLQGSSRRAAITRINKVREGMFESTSLSRDEVASVLTDAMGRIVQELRTKKKRRRMADEM